MNTVTAAQRLEVSRQDLRRTRLIDDPHAPQARPLANGEVRLRIDSFGLSSNNITYAAMGESLFRCGALPRWLNRAPRTWPWASAVMATGRWATTWWRSRCA